MKKKYFALLVAVAAAVAAFTGFAAADHSDADGSGFCGTDLQLTAGRPAGVSDVHAYGKAGDLVTFDPNEGVLYGDETAEADYGSKFEFGQYADRPGYSFKGWFTEKTGGTQVVSGGIWEFTGDTVLYAQWDARNYTVTFDPGEGRITVGDSTVSVVFGETQSFPQRAELAGYRFTGWFTSDNVRINAGDAWSIPEDTVLYAHWEAAEIIVSFWNGDTFLTDKTQTFGGRYDLLADIPKTGYTFGWFTDGGVQIRSGDEVKAVESFDLHAKWTANEYTVTFDANGGTEISESERTRTATYDAVFDIKTGITAREGYTFGGWFTYGGDEIVPGNAWTTAADTVLYAHWTADTYTVTFDANGGELEGEPTVTAVYGETFSFAQKASCVGRTFLGWFTEETGTTEVKSGDVWKFTDVVTLYAHWNVNVYTVTFDANGGKVVGGTAEATAVYGEAFIFTQGAELAGHTPDVWFTSDNVRIVSGNEWTIAADTVLYAHWTADTYTVTFDANGGVLEGGGASEAVYGEAFRFAQSASFAGYDFTGWYTRDIGGTEVKSGNLWEFTDVDTLYAQWTAKIYTVKFDANGGVLEGGETAAVEYGDMFVIDRSAEREGYGLIGWNTKADGTGDDFTWDEDEGRWYCDSWNFTDVDTVYAQWKACTYSVTFDTGGGTRMFGQTATYGEPFVIEGKTVRTGYDLAGWRTPGGDEFKSGDEWLFTDVSRLEACWNVRIFTLSFYDGEELLGEKEQTYGENYQLIDDPEKEGFDFAGWFTLEGDEITAEMTVEAVEDFSVYAKWTGNTITVSFYDGEDLLGEQDQICGGKYRLIDAPEKTGYNFAGWFTEKGGEGTEITADTTVEATEDFSVYANWTAKTFYLAFFDGKEFKGEKEQTYGEKYQLIDDPEKENYTFAGWFTADGDEITADMTVETTEGFSVYAKWTGNKITLSFYDGEDLLGEQEQAYGEKYLLIDAPEKTGYNFAGWFTEDGGEITADTTVEATEGFSVYAKWTAKTFMLVFFDGKKFLEEKEQTYGEKYQLIDAPGKTGYNFAGWFTADGDEITADMTVEATEGFSVYAKWTAKTFTLFFYDGEQLLGEQEQTYGEKYQLIEAPVPEEGYALAGWFTADGDEITAEMTVEATEDFSVYAEWKAKTFTVYFDPGEGKIKDSRGELCDHVTVAVTFMGKLAFGHVAVKEGYDFLGWFTADDVRYITGDTWKIPSDTTLFAHWEAHVYTITFNPNGGDLIGESTAKASYDQYFVFTQTAERKGCTFLGWFTDKVSGEQVESEDVWKYTDVNTLYAHWAFEKTEVIFNPNGGKLTGEQSTAMAEYNKQFVFDQSATRDGYAFDGWNTKSDGSGTAVVSGNVWVLSDSDTVTLYAQWHSTSEGLTEGQMIAIAVAAVIAAAAVAAVIIGRR